MAALDAGLPGPAAVGRSPAIQEAARAGASDPRLRALLLWYAAGLACLAGGETRLDGMSIFRQDRRLAAALRLVTNVELREVLTQEDLLGLRAALAADIRWLYVTHAHMHVLTRTCTYPTYMDTWTHGPTWRFGAPEQQLTPHTRLTQKKHTEPTPAALKSMSPRP